MMISRRNFMAVAGAAAAAAALTACGGSSSSTSTASSAASSSAASAAGSEAAGKIVKVALTCDTGTIDDESFNQACWSAVSAYMGDDCQYYIPEADASDEDRETMIRALLPATLEGPKPKGSSSSMLRSMKSSGVFAMMTFSSGPPNSNSA